MLKKEKVFLRNFYRLQVLSFLFCALCFSQKNTSEDQSKATRSFGLSGSIYTASTLHSFDDHRHQALLTGALSPRYQISDKLRILAVLSLSRDLVAKYPENEIGNPRLTLSYNTPLNPYLSFGNFLSGIYAINKTSIQRDSFVGALFLEPNFTLDFSRLGAQGLSLSYQLSLGKNFHEFNTSRVGTSNMEYQMTNALSLSYKILKPVSLSIAGARSVGWTYDTRAPRETFTLAQTLSYQALKSLSLSVTHSNGGAAYKENGIDSNISLTNENSSTITGGFSLVL